MADSPQRTYTTGQETGSGKQVQLELPITSTISMVTLLRKCQAPGHGIAAKSMSLVLTLPLMTTTLPTSSKPIGWKTSERAFSPAATFTKRAQIFLLAIG